MSIGVNKKINMHAHRYRKMLEEEEQLKKLREDARQIRARISKFTREDWEMRAKTQYAKRPRTEPLEDFIDAYIVGRYNTEL